MGVQVPPPALQLAVGGPRSAVHGRRSTVGGRLTREMLAQQPETQNPEHRTLNPKPRSKHKTFSQPSNFLQKVNLKIEQLGNLHNIIHIDIEAADYKEKFDKAIKDLGKKIQVPGFRIGHVPAGMVKKMYGDSILADELNKIVNDQMGNYLKENNFELFGDALPVRDEHLELNFNEPRSYQFSYEIGIQPEIQNTAQLLAGKTFTRYRIPAKEEEINQEVERMLKKYGKREDVEIVEENDVVYAHVHELNEDGSVKEGGVNSNTYFNLQMMQDDQHGIFLGAKAEEIKNIDDIFSVFKGDKVKIAKNILQLTEATEESVEKINGKFEFKIDRVARLLPAEMNEEFFKAVVPEVGEISTEAELRQNLSDNIEAYNNSMTEVTLENEIFKFLGETTEIPLPEVFLRKWFEKTNEKELSAENFEKEFEQFRNQLKQSLIYKKIQKEHDIHVEKEEIINEAVIAVRMSYGQLGDDFVRYVTESQLKDKAFVENMHDRVMQKKFFEALKGYVTVEEKQITLEEYQQITKKEEVYAE